MELYILDTLPITLKDSSLLKLLYEEGRTLEALNEELNQFAVGFEQDKCLELEFKYFERWQITNEEVNIFQIQDDLDRLIRSIQLSVRKHQKKTAFPLIGFSVSFPDNLILYYGQPLT